jgi:hypothetical protein
VTRFEIRPPGSKAETCGKHSFKVADKLQLTLAPNSGFSPFWIYGHVDKYGIAGKRTFFKVDGKRVKGSLSLAWGDSDSQRGFGFLKASGCDLQFAFHTG